MSRHVQPCYKGFLAGAAIPQYSFVKYGANEQTVVPSADAEKAIGVCMTDGVESGGELEVAIITGGALVKLSGSVALGDSVKSDAAGLGAVGGAGEFCPGIAMQAGVAGDVIALILSAHRAA